MPPFGDVAKEGLRLLKSCFEVGPPTLFPGSATRKSRNYAFSLRLFFFARSCLGKVPGRAPFSQLSKQATANTIRMQIVKQINENELDIRKLINRLCSRFQNELKRKRCSETKGAHRVKVKGRTGANSTDTAEVLLGIYL